MTWRRQKSTRLEHLLSFGSGSLHERKTMGIVSRSGEHALPFGYLFGCTGSMRWMSGVRLCFSSRTSFCLISFWGECEVRHPAGFDLCSSWLGIRRKACSLWFCVLLRSIPFASGILHQFEIRPVNLNHLQTVVWRALKCVLPLPWGDGNRSYMASCINEIFRSPMVLSFKDDRVALGSTMTKS